MIPSCLPYLISENVNSSMENSMRAVRSWQWKLTFNIPLSFQILGLWYNKHKCYFWHPKNRQNLQTAKKLQWRHTRHSASTLPLLLCMDHHSMGFYDWCHSITLHLADEYQVFLIGRCVLQDPAGSIIGSILVYCKCWIYFHSLTNSPKSQRVEIIHLAGDIYQIPNIW